jgi:hypoxanthine-guanine phosphoribosyltransferase
MFHYNSSVLGDLKAVIITEGMIKDRIKQLAREIHENIGDQVSVFKRE